MLLALLVEAPLEISSLQPPSTYFLWHFIPRRFNTGLGSGCKWLPGTWSYGHFPLLDMYIAYGPFTTHQKLTGPILYWPNMLNPHSRVHLPEETEVLSYLGKVYDFVEINSRYC